MLARAVDVPWPAVKETLTNVVELVSENSRRAVESMKELCGTRRSTTGACSI